jgi:hypothetical protein
VARKHHHVVSEGYQRMFATPAGIRLIDKKTGVAQVVGTKSAFARKHFSSYISNGEWSDELEDEWAQIEDAALPLVRALNSGAIDASGRAAAKAIAAVHYARSYMFESMITQMILQEGREAPSRIAADPAARAAFERDYGRPPSSGEIERLVTEKWTEHFENRTFLVTEMADAYNKTFAILDPLHVQLVWPRTKHAEFVFGDIPLVHWAADGRISALGGVALGDASNILLPLGPKLAAFFTKDVFADGAIEPDLVQHLNRKTWAAAMRFLGAHPDTNAKRSLLRWDLDVR